MNADYLNIAHLIGTIFMAGDFKAETENERELEALLIKTGHRYKNWDEQETACSSLKKSLDAIKNCEGLVPELKENIKILEAARIDLNADLEIWMKRAHDAEDQLADTERTSSAGSAVVMPDLKAWETIKEVQGTQTIDWKGTTAIVIESAAEAGDVARAILATAAPTAQTNQNPYGWLTGESISHRQGIMQELITNYEWAKEICDKNNELNRQYDPEHEDVIPVPLYAAAQAKPDVAKMIHYPECWDTAAYPTIDDAMREIVAFKCADCQRPTQTAAVQAESLDALLREKIKEAWANFERMGEVCSFEGQSMIYASTLEEIVEAAMSTNGDAAIGEKGNV